MHLKPNTDQEYRVLWKCTYYEFLQHSAELDDLPCSNYIHLQSFSVGKGGEGRRREEEEKRGGGRRRRREEEKGRGEGRRRRREEEEKGGEGRRRRREEEEKGGEGKRRRREEEKGGGRRRELELVFVSDEYSVTSAVQEQG